MRAGPFKRPVRTRRLCVADVSGNLLFPVKADDTRLNSIQFAQKKARHAALR